MSQKEKMFSLKGKTAAIIGGSLARVDGGYKFMKIF